MDQQPTSEARPRSAVLLALCAYYRARRIALGRLRASNRRMGSQRRHFYELAWRRAAEATGSHFTLLAGGAARIEHGEHRIRVCGSTTSLDSSPTPRHLNAKSTVRRSLAQACIPVPHHIVITLREFHKALGMLLSSRVPLVVKPAANTGSGAGVSTNVVSPDQLRTAVAWARAFCSRILVEEQVAGDCYRLLVMDDEVLDIVVRHPPRVTGDGMSTVRQLLRRENQLRLEHGAKRAQVLIRIDPDLYNTLAAQGLDLNSRPARGETVVVKRVINENNCHENASPDLPLCVDILDCAVRATRLAGLRLAGVDVICSNPDIPLESSGGVVLEVNANPGFYYHYHRRSIGCPVAKHVLNRAFCSAGH